MHELIQVLTETRKLRLGKVSTIDQQADYWLQIAGVVHHPVHTVGWQAASNLSSDAQVTCSAAWVGVAGCECPHPVNNYPALLLLHQFLSHGS